MWDKPGPLTVMERGRDQSNPYHTRQACPAGLTPRELETVTWLARGVSTNGTGPVDTLFDGSLDAPDAQVDRNGEWLVLRVGVLVESRWCRWPGRCSTRMARRRRS